MGVANANTRGEAPQNVCITLPSQGVAKYARRKAPQVVCVPLSPQKVVNDSERIKHIHFVSVTAHPRFLLHTLLLRIWAACKIREPIPLAVRNCMQCIVNGGM